MSSSIRIDVRINEAELEAALGRMALRIGDQGAGRIRDDAKRRIQAAGRVDTGAMMNSIRFRRTGTGAGEWRWAIECNVPYGKFQHDGVGPFGPRTARVLRFKPKGGKGFVFARHVRGFPGVPFLADAAKAANLSMFK